MERVAVSIRLSEEAVGKMKERVAQLKAIRPGYQTTTQSSLIEELIHLDHLNHILGTNGKEQCNA